MPCVLGLSVTSAQFETLAHFLTSVSTWVAPGARNSDTHSLEAPSAQVPCTPFPCSRPPRGKENELLPPAEKDEAPAGTSSEPTPISLGSGICSVIPGDGHGGVLLLF